MLWWPCKEVHHAASACCRLHRHEFFIFTVAFAADSKPNLTGTCKMSLGKSDLGSTGIKSRIDKIEHQEPQLKISTTQDDENAENTVAREYVTDGREMTHTVLGGKRKSSAHWEGDVLVIETKVNVPNGGYTIRDRWVVADDRRTIRIERQFSNNQGRTERILLEKQ